eukprot:TRINITY_DN31164_c0_g1_i1.p1 TRINITY_DN31164_c0_g1~~TRINITY_DN31164_c0_g1_i1.p1  ORF type:complete len:591 (-),score=120.43 TRINITY_DN31164_c0_g1_i1:260-2002(-)
MDSTRAIIRLWRLCSPAGVGPQDGGDGALGVDVIRNVLQGELQDKVESLGGGSVDDVLWKYMQPDASGIVGFLHFWRGMEDILKTCGAYRVCLSESQAHAIAGFRFLRSCVLEMAQTEECQGRSAIRVSELRYFIEKTTHRAGPEGTVYWQNQADLLPEDHVVVTGEEVASALLAWLEDLVEAGADEDGEEGSLSPRSTHSTASSRGSIQVDDSADEGMVLNRSVDVVSPWPGRPSMPQGPPPRRRVQSAGGVPGAGFGPPPGSAGGGSTSSSSVVDRFDPYERRANRAPSGGAAASGRGSPPAWRAGSSPLERCLAASLERFDRRPASPTKAQAAEWREAVEFHVALTRWLRDAQDASAEITVTEFHSFVRAHIGAMFRRTARSASPSPRLRESQYNRGAQVLACVLRGLISKRLEAGINAFLAARRAAARYGSRGVRRPAPLDTTRPGAGGPPQPGDFDIFRELFRAQCQAAVVLESRARLSCTVAGLAFHMERLIRRGLRIGWVALDNRHDERPASTGASAAAPAPAELPGRPAPAASPPAGYPNPAGTQMPAPSRRPLRQAAGGHGIRSPSQKVLR